MADEQERKTVTVGCRIPNGIELRLFRQGYDDGTGTGYRPMVADGDSVTLKGPSSLGAGAHNTMLSHLDPAHTEGVDAEFFSKWLEANKLNPMVTNGFIFVVDEPKKDG